MSPFGGPVPSRRWCALLLLALVPTLGAAKPADPDAWLKPAGASAERLREDVFGGHLMLYRAGKRGAEPVLLVHGLGTNGARDWARVIPALAPSHDVFAIDLPGFGRSAAGNELYSPENYARVIDQAVAPRIGRPFTLVGHSMGAAIALGYAAAHPQRVKRLVLVDMAGVLHGTVYAASLAKMGLKQYGGNVPADAQWLDGLLQGVLSRVDSLPVPRELVLRTPAMREKLLRGDPMMIAAFALGEHDFSSALREVRAPTLLIWGSEDEVAPLRTAQLAEATIPGARLELIPGAGHTPQLEAPDRFNRVLLEELQGTRGPAPAIAKSAELAGGPQHCDETHGGRYSGDIPQLTLIRCNGVEINGARIGELRVLESDVRIVNTEIRDGLYALRSRVVLTGGSIAGRNALRVEASHIDAAGTRLEAEDAFAVNLGTTPVDLRFSVAELRRRGAGPRYVHDSVRLEGGADW